MTEWLLPDAPAVTRDMALELMAHHLSLAAMYFEQVADSDETVPELRRLLQGNDPRSGEDNCPRIGAGLAFYDAIFAIYERMED